MDKQLIRAYLWQAVIRTGFCPESTKDKKSWIRLHGQSIREFWGIPSYPKAPTMEKGKIKYSIDCTDLLGLYLDCSVNSVHEFNVRFLYLPPQDNKELIMWTHDVDDGGGKYFSSPVQPFLSHKDEKKALAKFKPDDLDAVLNGLIFHPKAHQHIESPASLDNHHIRIGGGIDNPFLYLFHLRYQFCPDAAKRKAERDRLTVLFADACRNKSKITAHDLLAPP